MSQLRLPVNLRERCHHVAAGDIHVIQLLTPHPRKKDRVEPVENKIIIVAKWMNEMTNG